MINEDSNDQTQSNVMGEEIVFNEEDTTHTSEAPSKTSEPIAIVTVPKVSTPPASSVPTPVELDVYKKIY